MQTVRAEANYVGDGVKSKGKPTKPFTWGRCNVGPTGGKKKVSGEERIQSMTKREPNGIGT